MAKQVALGGQLSACRDMSNDAISFFLWMSKRKKAEEEEDDAAESDGEDTERKAPKKKKKRADPPIFFFADGAALEMSWRERKSPFLDNFLALLRDGFCVVPDRLGAEEVQKCLAELKAVEQCWPFPFPEPATTADKASELPESKADAGDSKDEKKSDNTAPVRALKHPPNIHGIRQWGPFGRLRVQEYLRSHLAVNEVFASFWGSSRDKLLSSSDAVCYGYPRLTKPASKKDDPEAQPDGGWLHLDQGFYHRNIWHVQGFVALTDQSKDKGCLAVRKGGHLAAGRFFDEAERFETPKARAGDWNKLTRSELDEFWPEDQFPLVPVEAKAGSLVLWFSHTPHQGCVPAVGAKEPRAVVYVCQKPRFQLPKTIVSPLSGKLVPLTTKQKQAYTKKLENGLKKKRQHLLDHRMTKHMPDLPLLFGAHAQHHGNPLLKKQLALFGERVEAAKLGLLPTAGAKKQSLDYLRSLLSEPQIAVLLKLNGF